MNLKKIDKRDFIKRLLFGIVGMILLGSGVGVSVKVGIGVDAFNSFCTGCSKLTIFSIGQVNAIVSVIMLIIIIFVDKKVIGPMTIINAICCQFPIDFAYNHFVASSSYGWNVVIYILSQAICCFGASMIVRSHLGATIYDGFSIGLANRLKVKYVIIKYIFEAIFLILAFVVKGPIGLGTVISFVVGGIFMDFFMKFMEKKITFIT